MSKIYVVFGEDGEYSDWSTWPIKAFARESDAEAFSDSCAKANKLRLEAEKSLVWPTSKWTPESAKDMTTGYYKEQSDFYKLRAETIKAIPHPDPDSSEHRLYAQYSVQEVELVE